MSERIYGNQRKEKIFLYPEQRRLSVLAKPPLKLVNKLEAKLVVKLMSKPATILPPKDISYDSYDRCFMVLAVISSQEDFHFHS